MDKKKKTLAIQIALFVATLLTTTLAGTEWAWGKFLFWNLTWEDFLFGFHFSIPFLLVLTVHEFGHYLTARYHKIGVTLPYYIPMWLGFIGMPTLGTMGAFIRIKEHIQSRSHYFDVGVSGPVAGFAVAVILMIYGFQNLPETSYIYEIHPEYELFGENFEQRMHVLDTLVLKEDLNSTRRSYEELPDTIHINGRGSVYFGDNILMYLGREYLAPEDRYVPSSRELMHYPVLLAAFLSFFFTALNLLPIGQLDGGHVVFGLFGSTYHRIISRVLFTAFIFYAGLGWVTMSDFAISNGNDLEGLAMFLIYIAIYVYIVYISVTSFFKEKINRLLFATVLFTVQFFVSSFFQIEGYSGWMFFAVLLGRFMGIDHPTVIDSRPLSPARKALGWLALLIFILSFSPQPLVVNGL